MTKTVNLIPITPESRVIFENLMCLYMHDLSEFSDDLKVNTDGRFEYEGLELYFQKDELMPFFIRREEEIIGFVLLNTGRYVPRDIDFNVHEFFILRGFRRRGLGAQAIERLFAEHRGRYKIEQLGQNTPAINFWKRLYTRLGIEYTESVEVLDGQECTVQVFTV